MITKNLSPRILDALKKSQWWSAKTRDNGSTIQGLVCPQCGDKSAWAYASDPMSINCNRLSQCGARTKTIELFPEIRRNIERDCPPTKADPHRPAREYLLSRGLSEVLLDGLDYRYLKNARNSGSGAVMFFVGKDEKGNEVLNGRLFCQPAGEGKTHNVGSTKGRLWRHSGFSYDLEKRTWITEGILNALSLLQLGEQAIAVLSAGQDPLNVDLGGFKNLVLSFDNDEAGRRACKKWRLVYPTAAVIFCDPGQDWNDLLVSGSADQVANSFKNNLKRYANNGELAVAATAQEYAEIWNGFYNIAPGLFTFNGSTYFSEKKVPRGGDIENAFIAVSLCFKATLRVVSFIIDRSNPARLEYLYNLEINPRKGKPIEAMATGPDLASHRRLKEWFLSFARINFEGDAKACTALASLITEDKKAPEVKQLAVAGYQTETGDYVFAKWAVDISGKLIQPDKQGNFRIGYNQYFRAPAHAEDKAIIPASIDKDKVKEIYELLFQAWGFNGIVALSWTVAGWFVNQLKAAVNFYPFLSLYGDPASGKSALVTILNAVCE